MSTTNLPYKLPLPTRPDASKLQESLRRRREELNGGDRSPAEEPAVKAAKRKKPKGKPMEPRYNQFDAQQLAHLEVLIRRGATDQELTDWRKERHIHHHTFGAAVRSIRERLDAPETPMAAQLAALVPVVPPADETAVVSAPAPGQSTQLDPVIQWLSTVRAMRDELAQHGVTVAGSLRIEIEL